MKYATKDIENKLVLTFLLLLLFVRLFSQNGPQGATGNWALKFYDEFNGTQLDLTKWLPSYPYHFPNNGLSHNHRAWIDPAQVTVADGKLIITATNKKHPNSTSGTDQWESSFGYLSFDYTSGAICTYNSFKFTTGFIEGSFKAPATLGSWPAFWALNYDKSWPPEIDILEIPADRNTHHYYYHYGSDWQNEKSWGGTHTGVDKSAGFHTYGVEWGANYMRFYFDGQIVKSFINKQEVSQAKNMYLILNLAIGGWAGNPPVGAVFPCTYECDWVRVWQPSVNSSSNYTSKVTLTFDANNGVSKKNNLTKSNINDIKNIVVTNLAGVNVPVLTNIIDNTILLKPTKSITNGVYIITVFSGSNRECFKIVI